jgi:hypothetical protein
MVPPSPVVSAAVAIAVILNGQPLDLHPPAIYAMVSPAQHRMGTTVMIPVRPVFEKLGWTVSAATRPTFSSIQLTKPGWQYVMMRTGETTLRVHEYTTPLPVAMTLHEGHLYVPMTVLKVVTSARVSYDNEAKTLTITCDPPDPPPVVTIGDIIGNPTKWLHQRVTINATLVGPEGDSSCEATSQGAPAQGALAFRDDTGAIYCSRCRVISCVACWGSDWGPREAGPMTMTGSVRLGYGDVPYLSVIARD